MKTTNYLSLKGSFLTLFTTHVLVIITHTLSLSLTHTCARACTHTHTHTRVHAKHLFQSPLCSLPPVTNCKVGGNHCHVPFVTTFDAHMPTVLHNDLVLLYRPSLNFFNMSFQYILMAPHSWCHIIRNSDELED
jgi:hypothetical protein